MRFPTMVYRCPGPHQRPGGTFNTIGIKDQAELDAALADGWFETLPEATGEVSIAKFREALEVLGDDAPPSRAELEKQASELGIKFKKSTTDDELNAKINEALEQ